MPRRLRPLADVVDSEPDPGQRAAAWALAGRAALSNAWPVPDPFTGRRSWLVLAVTLLVGVWVWLGAATVTEQVTPLDSEPTIGVVSDRDSRFDRSGRRSHRECRLQVSYPASDLPGRTWSHYSRAACDLAAGDEIQVRVSRSDPHDARIGVPGQGWLLPVAAAWTLMWTPALGALLWLSLRCWWWGRRWLTLAEGADPQQVSPGLRTRLQDAWERPWPARPSVGAAAGHPVEGERVAPVPGLCAAPDTGAVSVPLVALSQSDRTVRFREHHPPVHSTTAGRRPSLSGDRGADPGRGRGGR